MADRGGPGARPDAIAHADGTVSILLVPYDPSWAGAFASVAGPIREVLPTSAQIHHIGSTAVPGLSAKPRIDVQVSVGRDEDLDEVSSLLVTPRRRLLAVADDRRKRVLVAHAPVAVNVHVRHRGEFSQQAALLLRDFLRADEAARDRYRSVKEALAARRWVSVDAYADAKSDVVWALLRAADGWAAATAWIPPASDA